MKKIGGVLSIFVLTLALILPVSATDLFKKDLKYGMTKNSDVKRLQQYLKEQKLYSGPISGNYYGLTQAGIIKLQKKYSIKPANGKFTKITRDKINSLLLTKENTEQVIINVDTTQSEAQQLAESTEALRQYEITKAQQQVQSGAITTEEFAIRYPNVNPLPYLPAQPSQNSQPSQQTQNNPITQPSTQNPTSISSSTPSTINTTTTQIITSTPTLTDINWNNSGIYLLGTGYKLDPLNNGYPYYYRYICSNTNPYLTWASMQDENGFKKDIPNDTLGENSVIDWSVSTIGSFWINGTSADQYIDGPFIKSVTIQNIGTADLSKIGLYGFNSDIQDGLIIQPTNITSNSATFTFTNNLKYLSLGFKINPTKMNKGETLRFKIVSGELMSPDTTKRYILNLPMNDSPSKTLIKCDIRS